MTPNVDEVKRTHLITVLIGILGMGIFAADAHAYYHHGMGVFTSRDPGAGGAVRVGSGGPAAGGGFIPRDLTGSNQYADGMNLYQYVRSNPIRGRDPSGLRDDGGCNAPPKTYDLKTGAIQRVLGGFLGGIVAPHVPTEKHGKGFRGTVTLAAR